MTLFLMLLVTGVETQTASLSSNNYSALFGNTWYYDTLFYDDGVYLIIKGDNLDREGMTIHRWSDHGLSKVFTTTPREGLFSPRAAAVASNGGALYFSDFLAGLIFKYKPGGDFGRYEAKLHTEALAVYDDVLFRGNKSFFNNLEPVKGELPVLEKINKQLPEEKHAAEEGSNFNEMLLLVAGDKLVVAYKLQTTCYVFNLKNGQLLETIDIGIPFAGYVTPVDDFVELTRDSKKNSLLQAEWYGQFHSLMVLAWRDGQLYGLFRKGYEGQGIWARLDGKKGSDFVWDNNREERKLLAIGEERVITADKEEKDDGETLWTLYLNASLPSH